MGGQTGVDALEDSIFAHCSRECGYILLRGDGNFYNAEEHQVSITTFMGIATQEKLTVCLWHFAVFEIW